jgi:hypothetical protein
MAAGGWSYKRLQPSGVNALVIGLAAVVAAYLINQLPPLNRAFGAAANRLPLVRGLSARWQRVTVLMVVLVVAVTLTVISQSGAGDSSAIDSKQSKSNLRVTEFRLPDQLPGSQPGETPDSDEGAGFLQRAGLLNRGVLLDSRNYLFCTQVDKQSSECDNDTLYLLNTVEDVDFDRLMSEYRPDHIDVDQFTCYRRLAYGETLCRRQIGYHTWFLARFGTESAAPLDNSWPFADDLNLQNRDMTEAKAVIAELTPTGRSVDIVPGVIAYDGGSTAVTVTVRGLPVDDVVELEFDVPPSAASGGGICPKIVNSPCALFYSGGGKVGLDGTLEIHAKWRPCHFRIDGLGQLAGTYPIYIRDQSSGFTAITAFQVSVPQPAPPLDPSC